MTSKEWKDVKLKDITILISRGITPKYTDSEGVIVINQKCIRNGQINLKESRLTDDKTKKIPENKFVDNNDILICSTGIGTLGRVGFLRNKLNTKLTVDSHVSIVRANKDYTNPIFLGYNLFSRQSEIEAMAKGSTGQTELSRIDLGEMNISLPPLETQEKIARVLSSLDDKIELNNKINQNLEQQAQAIFKSWFVDNDNNIELKNGTFSDLIISTLGGDWGKDYPSQNYTEKVLCIRGADIPEIKLGHKGKMPIRYILTKNLINKKLVNDNLVVEISGGSPTQSTGRIALITNSLLNCYNEAIICTNFCRALKTQNHYSYFIYYYWQYLYDKNIFFSYENGTTGIKNLDLTGFLENESIKIPNKEIAIKFEAICSQFFKQISQNGKENEKLTQLRDTLLPKLMSGEIDVDKVEV